jgi:hypothetical protein
MNVLFQYFLSSKHTTALIHTYLVHINLRTYIHRHKPIYAEKRERVSKKITFTKKQIYFRECSLLLFPNLSTFYPFSKVLNIKTMMLSVVLYERESKSLTVSGGEYL